MASAQVASVRRFQRLVTQTAGALEEHFLGRDRPLGESRVLFEIAASGATLRDLRARLGLDSGYLSRLVQSLEARGLVWLEAAAADVRVRRATLTEAGLAELAEIDHRSDAAAAALLAPLSGPQRDRLVAAMEEVHRLLSYSALVLEPVDPTAPEAGWCLGRYFAELDERFEEGFEERRSSVADASELTPPAGRFLVGRIDGRPVACGGLKRVGAETAYLKRMWVDASWRGLGLGRRVLEALERTAAAMGCRVVQLETNRALDEAVRLYRSAGYREVEPFNDEYYADHWFEKRLPTE
jgi:DNA-binding MarR family transcriptional regulator/GNAT superfamily N-acetyltransferase